ncbi:MAG: hypothetical protein K0S65_725, partial [Labilithrix sp.]|nr:hypothetical protein [Labilithrix sp.]
MRKGRSSRRSRVSRPGIGGKAPSAVDALTTDVAINPRVVVGVTPSEPPPSEADSTPPPSVEARGGVDGILPPAVDPLQALETLEKVTVPPGALDTEEEALPLTSTRVLGSVAREEDPPTTESEKAKFASTLAFGSEHVADSPASVKPNFAATLVHGSVEAAAVEVAPPPSAPEPVKVVEAPLPTPKKVEEGETNAAKAESHVETVAEKPTATESKKNKKKVRAEERARAAAALETTDPDEVSVPPIGDISVDERFFS